MNEILKYYKCDTCFELNKNKDFVTYMQRYARQYNESIICWYGNNDTIELITDKTRTSFDFKLNQLFPMAVSLLNIFE